MSDGEKHVFVTEEGKEFSFDTEAEMTQFAVDLTIKNMVEKGLGEIVLTNGEEVFKINEKGLQYLKDNGGEVVH